jgi:hypothetical protein
MREHYKLYIDPKAYSDERVVLGRNDEINRLVNYLQNKRGSAVLVAGNRGSGKTSLIEAALKKLKALRYLDDSKGIGRGFRYFRSFTRTRMVTLSVPLLPVKLAPEKSTRDYVLSWIAQSLFAEFRNQSLIKRLTMPLLYGRKLRAVQKPLMYKSITKKRSGGIGLKQKSFNMEGKGQVELEINLEYADLELSLKYFLERYAKKILFVFVFDELDKYEIKNKDGANEGKELRAHEYILELKNLFTESKAKFIFTSTEDYYREAGVDTDDFDADKPATDTNIFLLNLFTNTMLITQLSPRGYMEMFQSLFIDKADSLDEQSKDVYETLALATLSLTDCYPFQAKKLISNLAVVESDGVRTYIDLVSVLEQLNADSYMIATLTRVIIEIYEESEDEKNIFLNRYLWLSMKKVVWVLQNYIDIEVNKSNLFALVFYGMDFETDAAKKAYMVSEFNPYTDIDILPEENAWEVQIANSGPRMKSHIAEAVDRLIWVLDALELIKVHDDANSISMIMLNMGYGEIPQGDIQDLINAADSRQHRLTRRRNKLSQEFDKHEQSLRSGIEKPRILTAPSEDARAGSGVEFTTGWELQSRVKLENTMLTTAISQLSHFPDDDILSSVVSKFPALGHQRENHLLVLSRGNKILKIHYKPTKAYIRNFINSDKGKLVAINAVGDRPDNRVRIKYIDFDFGDFSDYKQQKQALAKYITDYFS